MTCRHPHIAVILISLLWHVTHTYRNIFSGSVINFTVVCRVPSEEVSLRGCDSIGRPLPHPRLGCLIGPPAASSQMKGTLLTPNLCRPWSVPHLSTTCAAECREGRERGGEYPFVFFLSLRRFMETEAWTAWGNRRQDVWFHFVQALFSSVTSSASLFLQPPSLFVFFVLLFDSWIYIFYVSTICFLLPLIK